MVKERGGSEPAAVEVGVAGTKDVAVFFGYWYQDVCARWYGGQDNQDLIFSRT